MRVLLVFAPLFALACFAAARALLGKPLSRRALDVTLALLLLGYLLATAGLGIFWVARMDLPAFDWHYLFGYALLLVAAAHVALQARGMWRWVRSRRTAGEAAAATPAGRRALLALLGVATLGATYAVLALRPRVRGETAAPSRRPSASPRDVDERGAAPLADARARIEQLHRESSYARSGLLRRVAIAPPRPPDVRPAPPGETIVLAPAPAVAERSLDDCLERACRPAPGGAPLDRERLASLLFLANGSTETAGGLALRASASAGALYPTDPFLAVLEELPGLAPGVYHHDGPAHRLVRVAGAEAIAPLRAALPTAPGLDGTPALVVLGTTYDRSAWKYSVRSARYVALDAGHLAMNLAIAAAALDLPCRPLPHFDDAGVAAALGLSLEVEAPLLVLALGGPFAASPPWAPLHETTVWPGDAERRELTRVAVAATSLVPRAGFRWLEAPTPPRPPAGTALPAAAPATEDAFAVIHARRSFRSFAAAPVTRAELGSLLRDVHSVLGRLAGVPLIEPFVAVRAVEGVAPGTYRFDGRRHALAGPLGGEVARLASAGLGQEVLGRAAFVVAFALLDEAMGTVAGVRDHRLAGLEAGLAGECGYLSAQARGLGACGVGAFHDDELASLFREAGREPRVVHLLAVGRKA